MGLDFLDIVFRIERTFAISVEHDELEQIVHNGDIVVGDLYDFVLKKMHLRDIDRYDIRLNYLLWTVDFPSIGNPSTRCESGWSTAPSASV